MAIKGMVMALAMSTLIAALFVAAAAQSNCMSVIISLSPCLNYITMKSSTASPSCCSQLAKVVQSEPRCLCAVLDGGAAASLGITINQTRALALPSACNVETPPVSKCKASSPAESPIGGTQPSGGDSSAATRSSIPLLPLFLLFLLIASSAAKVPTGFEF